MNSMNASILWLHLYIVFNIVVTRETVPMKNYYGLNDYKVIAMIYVIAKRSQFSKCPEITFSERNDQTKRYLFQLLVVKVKLFLK